MKKVLAGVVVLLVLSQLAVAQSKSVPYVILVSFDGFRHDYATKFALKNFNEMAQKGSHTKALIPCFPSKTFPNHYSIATGLYPGHHGLVDNSFIDPTRKEKFSMANKRFATDSYYFGGTPIWHLAQQQGLKTAPYYWVGSEASFDHQFPTYYAPYADTIKNSVRIEKVLTALKFKESERPHFLTLYFSLIDDAGHSFGPNSNEVREDAVDADLLLGQLRSRLTKEIPFPVNIIVVSDHGMAEVKYAEDTFVYLDELVSMNDADVTVVNNGTHAHFYLSDKTKIDSVVARLKKNTSISVFRYSEFPSTWHYQNDRAGDILITAAAGKEITMKSRSKVMESMKVGSVWGAHGYDPDINPDMGGIFYAVGPNIRKGVVLEPFQNIHVYPLIAKILGLKMPEIDGSFNVLQRIYKP